MSGPAAPRDPLGVRRLRRSIASRPMAWGVTALIAALLIGSGGAVALAFATTPSGAPLAASSASTAASGTSGASAVANATPTPSPTATPTPTPSPTVVRTCVIDAAATAPGLGRFEGFVMNAATGTALFDRSGETPAATGSVMKTLTTATALAVLGPDYRIPTTVTDEGAGTIALVGHGDPTLSQGGQTVYTGAPTLAALAAQVKAHLGTTPITTIVTDDSYWNDADAWDPSWPVTERTIGYQPEVTALMVDGDRANPALETSPRSTDPVGRAGSLFRTALEQAGVVGAASAQIVHRATTSTTVIGEVESQPVSTLIAQMIPVSDNTLAEMLERISSVRAGYGGSAASLTALDEHELATAYGIDATGITIRDGSGESPDNAVPPTLIAHLMVQVQAGAHGLGVLAQALPVSGETGTLVGRFTGANAVARGHVHAKTGWIDGAETLGGYIDAADGTRLTFAFYALGSTLAAALPALDTVTTAVYRCGNNLSNA
ncbi:D-alanyl-D-alanine carboxypeptidase/D-alanyl-D-alanine-endopeptidase [Curtobacterium ammoniigenes]|uniref:D-alanyl-D-alanine carboxypeptidase/D-alanyl-D-alanine-endopeptidase n=1 Tax=Curtobacterium ammoniigenes TaxID=395387 RepID=UPI0012ECF333|nr:D-alanyl-D-alanine carboxypeptidase [Curtobacterium ammoniigenes]